MDKKWESKYEDFLMNNEKTLLYVSNKYRKLLKQFLGAKDCYFLAVKNGEIVGALPAFLKVNSELGNVLNSLPFYGSNGGVIELRGDYYVRKILLAEFYSFAKDNKCISATIITSPFEANIEFYEKETNFTYKDVRIGQITQLPENNGDVSEKIMRMVDGVRRRNIRKAIRNGIVVKEEFSEEILRFLIKTHTENISSIGGIPKPKEFFELIPKIFDYDREFKIFTAFKDNIPVASLLVFYFNKTVEYFTPAIVKEFRPLQPLSLLIFTAMQEAIKKGYKYWNWGGTWVTQESLYRFKKRWGTEDFPYYYYTKIYDRSILNVSEEKLIQEFPYFYVFPFGRQGE